MEPEPKFQAPALPSLVVFGSNSNYPNLLGLPLHSPGDLYTMLRFMLKFLLFSFNVTTSCYEKVDLA